MKPGWESVIGLEVHVQIRTRTKLFCACPTEFGAEPNSHLCPVCAGHPGVLPVLNRRAVEGLVKTALAVGCRINGRSVFARKQYFYPDLPKAYQISQYEQPLAVEGRLEISTEAGTRVVGIERIHLEEDAGKLLHAVGSRVLDYSLVDLNRTGIPLMEIVSKPDMRTPDEAAEYLVQIRNVVRTVGASECDMEKGSMRCDANVSVRRAGETALGVKAEVKNMNSFKAVKDAIAFEIERQVRLLEEGGRVVQETRLWDQAEGTTRSMRSKEEAHDYRYFPDPDLPPVELSEAQIEEWRRSLPELPEVRRVRFEKELGLSAYDAGVLTSEKTLADYFESGLSTFPPEERKNFAKPMVNWTTSELLGHLNADKKDISESPMPSGYLASLVGLSHTGVISGKTAKIVFEEAYSSGGDPKKIVEEKGLLQVQDENQIKVWVDEAIAANPKIVADIKGGKEAALGSLVGQVMKKSSGRANPQTVNKLLREVLLSPR